MPKLCECGCGKDAGVYTRTRNEGGRRAVRGEPRRFVPTHSNVPGPGRPKGGNPGERDANPHWKGDDAGYSAKHKWINRKFPKTGVCEHCGGESRDYANISGSYLRTRDDWLELCVPCHKTFDAEKTCAKAA